MANDTTWAASMPAIYDADLGPAIFAPFAAHVASVAAALSPAPARVLEVAAGTGIGTRALVAALPEAAVTATDLNQAMVDHGAAHVPGPTWQVADATALGLPDASFDLVVCQFGAMFFPDRPAAYAELRRVLAPGGSLVLSIWDDVALSGFTVPLLEALVEVYGDAAPTFISRIPHGYTDPVRICADLSAGGLTVASLDHVTLTGHAPSAQVVTEGFCLGTPLRFALAELDDLDQVVRKVLPGVERRLGSGPLERESAAIVVVATA